MVFTVHENDDKYVRMQNILNRYQNSPHFLNAKSDYSFYSFDFANLTSNKSLIDFVRFTWVDPTSH